MVEIAMASSSKGPERCAMPPSEGQPSMPADESSTAKDATAPGAVLTTSWSLITSDPPVSLRADIATHLMHSAVHAARRAHAVEAERDPSARTARVADMLQTVPVSTIMASAAIEAHLNETIQDQLDIPTICYSKKFAFENIKERRSGSAWDKFPSIACLMQKGPPDKNNNKCKNMKLLIDFRNALIHFKPMWDNEKASLRDLVRDLEKKHQLFPLI
ncbi:hypothetical protein [Roseicella sp. DB1501]|uniref:hypothetical protein n=1 Tax=Roseicella sp. DB1501 TaxID=2730925 RepID=UPI001490B1AC|nr:hypothetical protein [Roseicella sp. DB1501]NOG70500.1 hypothetical protein [Roseicella sp. DB1501]